MFFGYLLPSILTLIYDYEELRQEDFGILNGICDTILLSIKSRFDYLFEINEKSKIAITAAVLIPSVKLTRWLNMYKRYISWLDSKKIIRLILDKETTETDDVVVAENLTDTNLSFFNTILFVGQKNRNEFNFII